MIDKLENKTGEVVCDLTLCLGDSDQGRRVSQGERGAFIGGTLRKAPPTTTEDDWHTTFHIDDERDWTATLPPLFPSKQVKI